ncbi:MAG: molybdopterin oxidoreductase [Bdellovibrionaceae bacterium]|nr:molybdopterin oxidoreductase [Pseudobdellovibrionaceae bacterium]
MPGQFVPSQTLRTIYSVAIFLGLVLFGLALFKDGDRAWYGFLTAFMYWTNLALGGLFFAAIQHVTKAGWSVNIRRIAESFTAFLPIAAIGAVVLLLGSKHLYIWLDSDVVAKDAILQGKSAYLNPTFFVIRLVVFFGLWLTFSKLIIGNSLKQDQDGDTKWTLKNVGLSIAFLFTFALSYSLFSVDTLMSLQPHWFSTIWGIYNFAGLFQSFLAMLILFVIYSMKKGWLRGLVSEDHLHDLGKFLKGFTVFMAYIGFSQFILIWYANLPEETIFYLARSNGWWMAISFSLLILKFAVPFLLLLPRWAKRTPSHLAMVSVLILIMQYVDIHWMVYPNLDPYSPHFSWQEIGPFALLGGLFLWSVTGFLSKNKLVPVKDPRIEESIHHHVVY